MLFEPGTITSLSALSFAVHSISPRNAFPMEVVFAFSVDVFKRSLNLVRATLDPRMKKLSIFCSLPSWVLILLFFLGLTALDMPIPSRVKSHYIFAIYIELSTVPLRNVSGNLTYLVHPTGYKFEHFVGYMEDE